MATIAEVRAGEGPAEPRFVLYGVGWRGYETMLDLVGDRPIRLTYDRGNLELMSPSQDHEKVKSLVGRLVEALTEELDIPSISLGSTTWRREDLDRGLEADECFYLFDHAERFQGRTSEPGVDPPPDLAVEIDITRSSLNRQDIYGALGVPEVWRLDASSLQVLLLRPDGRYDTATSSRLFPFLPLDEVARRLREGAAMTHSLWGRQVRAWIRDELAPRYREARHDPKPPNGAE
jgi:Uma2 family endonuclease